VEQTIKYNLLRAVDSRYLSGSTRNPVFIHPRILILNGIIRMPKYYVASGPEKVGMEEIVVADSPMEAAIAAVERRNWEMLGIVMLISETGFVGDKEDDLWVLSTAVTDKADVEYHLDQEMVDEIFRQCGINLNPDSDPENPKDF
jgi:hypothetical protein